MGAIVKAEVEEIKSLNGKVEAEVDAGQGYVSVIGRAPKNGHQSVALLRFSHSHFSNSYKLALIVFDKNDADDPVSKWVEAGWELVLCARPL